MTNLDGQAMDLFVEVVELSSDERKARLQVACQCVPELRARVEELLAHHREAESIDFLRPAPAPDFGAVDKVPPKIPGYKTLTLIDQGGMGMVWLVRDLRFKRLLALKVMRAAVSADPHRVRRFLVEGRITGRLAHPSIVPVHAMGRLADGRRYYTMKFVDGPKMADLLKAQPDVASRRMEFLQVFARVCQVVAFAHSEGVTHGDLKPSNVMVGKHGVVQVMDWGEAKVLTQSNDWPGRAVTWPYSSPEQANDQIEKIGQRSDVFGLGAMLCVILTGKPPYVGLTSEDVKRQAREADLADAHARLEACGADRELIDLAHACLSPEPNDRPEDASVVEKRLTDYLASVEQRLRAAERDRAAAEARAKEARRRMRWVAASAGLFLSLLLVTALFAWRESEMHQKLLAATISRAMTAAMSADLDAADQLTAEAEQAGASSGQVHMLRGQIALHRGQSREAMHHLEEAVRLLPKSVAAWGMLAAAYADDGDWERYDKAVREMKRFSPSTPEDFLFKGYAEAYLEPETGLQTIKQAFDRRPMWSIALLVRAEVRAMLAQDTDDLDEAEGAVQDAKFAKELLHDNPTALWVSLEAHLAKAGVHKHRGEPDQRVAELKLAEKDADALKPFTALPEAVVYRWTCFRELGREKEVLDELRQASNDTDHVYGNCCCALTLYWRGDHGDLEEALRVLKKRPRTYNDRLLPFVLAEHDYHPDKQDWQARALEAYVDFAGRTQDGAAVMDAQSVLRLLGQREDAVKASKALLAQPERFYTLRREPILQCLRYNAGELSAEELLQSAGRSRWNQCLAHYNIAMTKLSEGDREGAKNHFDKAVETRAWGWGEYDMSWVFQARLANDPKWPPWIPARRAQ
jgi:tetratricopeptide (TPR) repeat protein